MGKSTKEIMKEDAKRAEQAKWRAANRARLASYTFRSVSEKEYENNVKEKTSRVLNFDAKEFEEYNSLRSKEFSIEFARKMKSYNIKLTESVRKTETLEAMGVKNKNLYCAELTDKIFKKTTEISGFSEYIGVTATSNPDYCPVVAKEMDKKCKISGAKSGFAPNIGSKIKGLQDKDPYGCYMAVIGSEKNVSGSGLHQVMIAPALDKDNNVIMGKDGKPKMSVYKFNKEEIIPLEDFKESGTIFSLSDLAKGNALEQVKKGELTPADIKGYIKGKSMGKQKTAEVTRPNNKEIKIQPKTTSQPHSKIMGKSPWSTPTKPNDKTEKAAAQPHGLSMGRKISAPTTKNKKEMAEMMAAKSGRITPAQKSATPEKTSEKQEEKKKAKITPKSSFKGKSWFDFLSR